jgi:hypothetical protein
MGPKVAGFSGRVLYWESGGSMNRRSQNNHSPFPPIFAKFLGKVVVPDSMSDGDVLSF